MDHCPNCGNTSTNGRPCNLTCKRALQNKFHGSIVSQKEHDEMREGLKAAFITAQVERFMDQLEDVRFDLPKPSTEGIEYW